jgi:uncharacterized protein
MMQSRYYRHIPCHYVWVKLLKITREPPNAVTIRKVEAGEIQIGAQSFRNPVVIAYDQILGDWPDKNVADLTLADFAHLLTTKPEMIVLGTVKNTIFAPKEIIFALARRGIGFEVMNTSAAARTFNVLASEGRKIAAILYLNGDPDHGESE